MWLIHGFFFAFILSYLSNSTGPSFTIIRSSLVGSKLLSISIFNPVSNKFHFSDGSRLHLGLLCFLLHLLRRQTFPKELQYVLVLFPCFPVGLHECRRGLIFRPEGIHIGLIPVLSLMDEYRSYHDAVVASNND
jgi:hypothetical protein